MSAPTSSSSEPPPRLPPPPTTARPPPPTTARPAHPHPRLPRLPPGNLLQALPSPLLLAILGFVEGQGQSQRLGCLPEPNRLLPLRHVSKGLRAAVDERLSYLTVSFRPENDDEPTGQSMVRHSLLLLPGFPRWPALRRLSLSVEWGTFHGLQFALGLAAATCPSLERLDIKDNAAAHLDAGSVEFGVLSTLTRLHTLGVHGFEDPFFHDLGELVSVSTLEVYDVWEHGRLRTGPRLERLVLDRFDRGEREPLDVEVELMLQASQNLQSMRVGGYMVSVAVLPDTLTSLSLCHMHIVGSPETPVELPKLLELELKELCLEQQPFQLHLPTALTSLKLCCTADMLKLPLVERPLDSLPALKHLQLLRLEGLDDFDHLPDLSGCSGITSLVLGNMKALTCVQALSTLVSLQTLEVKTCSVVSIPPLGALSKLSKVCLWDLVLTHPLDLRPLTFLVHLEYLRGNDFPILDGLKHLRFICYEPRKARDTLLLPPLPRLEDVVLKGQWYFEVEGLGPSVCVTNCFVV